MSVYTILKQSNHDYTPAEKYGHLEVLFPLGVNTIDIEVISNAARKWFEDFDFDEDVFLPIGNPIVSATVSMCLIEEMYMMRVPSVKMLEWDKYTQEYVVREFSLCEELDNL